MEKTTSKKLARARILEQQAAREAERRARERQNADSLAEFVVATAKADDVDAWLAERLDKVRQAADVRRRRYQVEAGKALQAMRFRGETVTGIAAQAGITAAKVREYLKLATADAGSDGPDALSPGENHGAPAVTNGSAGGSEEQSVEAGLVVAQDGAVPTAVG
ncbi:hypothetical protein KL864_31060 [Mycolicibacterium goodii]|uniref:hypothetical protein n=1 Tax=Mycolicibacterium goodii TaxID=134601 RepID=UPI001BDD3F90|nr:hypothetical protein [Mycolicibacterium goodii]MBU8820322.1 hypothetical protein [Mycolicibacterium goodii]